MLWHPSENFGCYSHLDGSTVRPTWGQFQQHHTASVVASLWPVAPFKTLGNHGVSTLQTFVTSQKEAPGVQIFAEFYNFDISHKSDQIDPTWLRSDPCPSSPQSSPPFGLQLKNRNLLGTNFFTSLLAGFPRRWAINCHFWRNRERQETGPPALTRRLPGGVHLVLGQTLGKYHENQRLEVGEMFRNLSQCTSTSFWYSNNQMWLQLLGTKGKKHQETRVVDPASRLRD